MYVVRPSRARPYARKAARANGQTPVRPSRARPYGRSAASKRAPASRRHAALRQGLLPSQVPIHQGPLRPRYVTLKPVYTVQNSNDDPGPVFVQTFII